MQQRMSPGLQPPPRPFPGSRSRRKTEPRLRECPSGLAIDDDRFGLLPSHGVHDEDRFPFPGRMPVSEGKQGQQHGLEIATAPGQRILMPGRAVL